MHMYVYTSGTDAGSSMESPERRSNVQESIDFLKAKPGDYKTVLKGCIAMGHIDDQGV